MLIRALAVWRLCTMLLDEAGPFRVFSKYRELAGGANYEDGGVSIAPSPPWGCIHCLSVWLGLLSLAVPVKVCMPLAISALVVLINRLYEGDA